MRAGPPVDGYSKNKMLSWISVFLSNVQASTGSYFTTYLHSPALELQQWRMDAFQVKIQSGTSHHSSLSVFGGEVVERGKSVLQKGPSAASPVQWALLTQSCLARCAAEIPPYPHRNIFPLWVHVLSCPETLRFPWSFISRASLWHFHLPLYEQSKKT